MITDDMFIETCKKSRSMAEAAREIGVCGQTIRNRCDSKQFKNYYII